MLRVLLYPVYNQHILSVDSIYHTTESLARHLAEKENCHVYWVVPEGGKDGDSNITWYKTEKTLAAKDAKIPNGITILQKRLCNNYRFQEVVSPEWLRDMFHPIYRDAIPIDVIVTTSAIHGMYLTQTFKECYNKTDPIPVVVYDQFLRGADSKEVSSVGDAEIVQQSMGLVLADAAVYESPFALRQAIANGRGFLQPSVVKEWLEKPAYVVPVGADFEKLNKNKRDDKFKTFSLYMGGRVTASKGLELVASVAELLYKSGADINIEFTPAKVGKAKVNELIDKYKSIKYHEDATQEIAFKVMTRCHVAICASTHELFGKAYWEQLYAGLIVLFKREDWNQGLLPPNYPLVFDTAEEAYVLLKDIYENYDSWLEKMKPFQQWVADNYDHRTTYHTFFNILLNVVEKSRKTSINMESDLSQAILRGALLFNKDFTSEDLENKLSSAKLVNDGGLSLEGSPARLRSFISRAKLRRVLMNSQQFVDNMVSKTPIYSRK